jgi:hypothetical protein
MWLMLVSLTQLLFVRDDYMTHGLHLKSRGNRMMTHLIAEVVSERYVSSVGSMPANSEISV